MSYSTATYIVCVIAHFCYYVSIIYIRVI